MDSFCQDDEAGDFDEQVESHYRAHKAQETGTEVKSRLDASRPTSARPPSAPRIRSVGIDRRKDGSPVHAISSPKPGMLTVAGSPAHGSSHGHPGARIRAKHPWSRPVSALDPPKPASVSGNVLDKHRPYSALTAPPQVTAGKKAPDGLGVPSSVNESFAYISDPTAYSKQNIKERLAKERARAQAFKRQMLQEESERLVAAQAKILQANTWSFQLGLSRSYEIIAPMLDEETALEFVESDVRVVITDSQDGPSSLKTRNISLPMFLKEFDRLQALVHQQERAGSGRGGSDRLPGEGLLALGDGTSRPGSARVGRTTRPASALSSRTTSVSGVQLYSMQSGAVPPPSRPKQPSKAEVQAELRKLLEDTVALTQKLQCQVHELKSKGWNKKVA